MIASLNKITSGAHATRYYQGMEREDYYNREHDESRGKWLGSGAAELGLIGELEPKDERFKRLLDGRHPQDPEIALRAGSNTTRIRSDGTTLKPVAAYDFTFSAPKSVSVLWAASDGETQAKIEAAHDSAMQKAWQHIETQSCLTRRGRGGSGGHEHVKPIAAAFQHGTSRENDPQLHTHIVLINAGLRADGRCSSSLDGRLFMGRGKEALVHKVGSIYRQELRTRLERDLSLETKTVALKHGSSFELTCVPEGVSKTFSTRRTQINAELSAQATSKEVQYKVLATRKAKDPSVSSKEIFATWKQQAAELGFSPKQQAPVKEQELLKKTRPPKQEPAIGAPPPAKSSEPTQQPKHRVTAYEIERRLYLHSVWRLRERRQEDLDSAFRKAQEAAEARAKRFRLSVTFKYATGQMSHTRYKELTDPKARSKFGIHASHVMGQISKKERDRLLLVNGHQSREEWLKSRPTTRLGINFAYATRRIENKERLALLWHNGHLKRELEAERLPLFPSVPWRDRQSLNPLTKDPLEFNKEEPKVVEQSKEEPSIKRDRELERTR